MAPAVKFVLISALTIVLLIPSVFVWVLVEERAERARDVARDIAGSWGGVQQINGPYLVVPFSETVTIGTGEKGRTEVQWRKALFLPQKLEVTGKVGVEERRKSIYSLPVYSGSFSLSGNFAPLQEGLIRPQKGGTIDVKADEAVLVIGIGDIRALKSEVALKLADGRSVDFEPGLGPLAGRQTSGVGHAAIPSGIAAAVPASDLRKGFAFNLPIELNGSTALYVAPAGQTTKVQLSSDWPHPGFTGAFLPDNREISEAGFEAAWSIPSLARGIPKVVEADSLPLQETLLGVKFVEPVDFYQTIARSLKYAICFISLAFLAVFVLEQRSGWQVHWIQYGLVGLALIVFYVMLLAFAEHVGYAIAYLGAATAATVLNAVYIGSSLRSRMAGAVMFAVLAVIFGVLYALMQEQDYALLIGSVIAFLALAVTMFATQRIDWSGQSDDSGKPVAEPV
ncbi:cell envelope integrity protein CreD [Roseibium sp. M-1]